ncbi:MAG: RNA polymerase subunit sigma-24 [Methylophaga sp.]|nr:MAG: RNA polymerase subunit sigma-24 [Methylophaga sp.]
MIFDRTSLNTLFHYCLALCGDRDSAYDLLQDSVEKYLKQNKLPIQNQQAYIKRIIRNHFFDLQRRKKIVHFVALDDVDSLVDTEKSIESLIIDELTLKKIWQQLTPDEREVIFLWAAEGLSASAIALQLNMPRGTVLSRLRRLRLRIDRKSAANICGGFHD